MADPVSLAASIAGLISLGLQVTSGISNYIDAVNCRDQELRDVRQQNDLLKQTLVIIETTSSRLEKWSPEITSVVKQSVEANKDSLNALESFVAQKLAGVDVGTWRSRLGKLHYAFDRPKLQQLCNRVSRTQSGLQLAIDGLGLFTVAATHGPAMEVADRILQLQNRIDNHSQATITQVFTSTESLSDQLGKVGNTLQSSLDVQQGYLERIEKQNSNLLDKAAITDKGFQSLKALLIANRLNNLTDTMVRYLSIQNYGD